MKKILFSIIISLLMITSFNAQTTPQGMKYQAVARDLSGEIIANQPISLKIKLQSDINLSQIYYTEVHNVTTNQFGLFSLVVGQGNIEKGVFNKIPWETENIWIDIAMKTDEEDNYSSVSISKLLAVPYAFHAATASKISDGIEVKGGSGVPSQNWSLFGNSKSDPDKDKLGTTDEADLVLVTNDEERMRIFSNGDINMKKSLSIDENLTVAKNVYLNTVEGETINNGPFTVENQSLTLLTGDLHVNGFGQFDSNINIDASTVTDMLVVSDEVSPDPIPRFGSLADVRGLFVADSIAIRGGLDIGGNLKVHGDSVIVDHHFLVGERTFLNGQVTINTKPALTGGDNSYDAYPLRVEGSNQGIAVKVNGTRNNSKNFITFWDDNGRQGRIEGQTSLELLGSFQYIWDNMMAAFDLVAFAAEGVACGTQLDAAEVVVMAAQAALKVGEIAEYNLTANANVGVAFESGSGDYAEWLEKAIYNETFSYGDIVGVRGGKISKNMTNANHFMVVSKSPIVLGNMPPVGKEANFEKIAFMGQVQVKVKGKVTIGDYIIASMLKDGFGIAVSPNDITLDQFERIVGVAWSEAVNDFRISMVNVAVGINANDLVLRLKQQDKELNLVKNQMNSVISYLQSKDKSFDIKLFDITDEKDLKGKVIDNKTVIKQFDITNAINKQQKLLQDNPELLKQILSNTRKILDAGGIDYNRFEQTRRLVTDDKYFINYLNEINK